MDFLCVFLTSVIAKSDNRTCRGDSGLFRTSASLEMKTEASFGLRYHGSNPATGPDGENLIS